MEGFIIYLQHDIVLEGVDVDEISVYFKSVAIWHSVEKSPNTIFVGAQKITLLGMENFNQIVSLFIDCSNRNVVLRYIDYGYYWILEKTL